MGIAIVRRLHCGEIQPEERHHVVLRVPSRQVRAEAEAYRLLWVFTREDIGSRGTRVLHVSRRAVWECHHASVRCVRLVPYRV